MQRPPLNEHQIEAASEYMSQIDLDALIDHPYWEPMGKKLDDLARGIPETTQACERTTILTWIYLANGVMTFLDLSERITGKTHITERKKTMRRALRLMETVHLIAIVNFPDPDETTEDFEGIIGRRSLISLTWTGMVWLRRAWSARATMMGDGFDANVHAEFVNEEDSGKSDQPYWVENLIGADPEMAAMAKRASYHRKDGPQQEGPSKRPVSSIFDLGRLGAL